MGLVTRDYYGDARVIAVQLGEIGLDDWAAKIEHVLEGGATSSEILMGLRWNLRQLLADNPGGLSDELSGSVAELADAIDGVLR